MHADEKEEGDDTVKVQPGEVRKPKRRDKSIPLPQPERLGGFYARVSLELFGKLRNLSPRWGITVKIVVAPNFMTQEEEKEMEEYHAARREVEMEIDVREAANREKEEMEARIIAEKEHKERRMATYARAIDPEAGVERYRKVNVHITQGALWNSYDQPSTLNDEVAPLPCTCLHRAAGI